MENAGGAGKDIPKVAFSASKAFGEFASAAMSASMLITSIKNAAKVWSDDSATGFEKIGAAISVLMPLYSGFAAV